MTRRHRGLVALAATYGLLALSAPTSAQQQSSFDYWQYDRNLIQRGLQAMFMCNGLFVSKRTLERIFEQELAFLEDPVGTAGGGDYVIDRKLRAVAVGKPDGVPIMRAAFRPALPPHPTFVHRTDQCETSAPNRHKTARALRGETTCDATPRPKSWFLRLPARVARDSARAELLAQSGIAGNFDAALAPSIQQR